MAVTDREGAIGGLMKEEHTRASAKPGLSLPNPKGQPLGGGGPHPPLKKLKSRDDRSSHRAAETASVILDDIRRRAGR